MPDRELETRIVALQMQADTGDLSAAATAVGQVIDRLEEIDKQTQKWKKETEEVRKKYTWMLPEINKVSQGIDSIHNTAQKAANAIGAIGQTLGAGGLMVSFQAGASAVIEYNKQLIGLSAQYAKYGKGIIEVESRMLGLGKRLSLTRHEMMNLFKTMEKGLPYASLEATEKILTNIRKVVGSNEQAISEMAGTLMSLMRTYPSLQKSVERMNESDKKRLDTIIKMELATGRMDLQQAKALSDYVAQNKQFSQANEEKLKAANKQLNMQKDMKKLYEEIMFRIGGAILPLVQKLADFIEKNKDAILKTAEFFGKWVAPLLLAKTVLGSIVGMGGSLLQGAGGFGGGGGQPVRVTNWPMSMKTGGLMKAGGGSSWLTPGAGRLMLGAGAAVGGYMGGKWLGGKVAESAGFGKRGTAISKMVGSIGGAGVAGLAVAGPWGAAIAIIGASLFELAKVLIKHVEVQKKALEQLQISIDAYIENRKRWFAFEKLAPEVWALDKQKKAEFAKEQKTILDKNILVRMQGVMGKAINLIPGMKERAGGQTVVRALSEFDADILDFFGADKYAEAVRKLGRATAMYVSTTAETELLIKNIEENVRGFRTLEQVMSKKAYKEAGWAMKEYIVTQFDAIQSIKDRIFWEKRRIRETTIPAIQHERAQLVKWNAERGKIIQKGLDDDRQMIKAASTSMTGRKTGRGGMVAGGLRQALDISQESIRRGDALKKAGQKGIKDATVEIGRTFYALMSKSSFDREEKAAYETKTKTFGGFTYGELKELMQGKEKTLQEALKSATKQAEAYAKKEEYGEKETEKYISKQTKTQRIQEATMTSKTASGRRKLLSQVLAEKIGFPGTLDTAVLKERQKLVSNLIISMKMYESGQQALNEGGKDQNAIISYTQILYGNIADQVQSQIGLIDTIANKISTVGGTQAEYAKFIQNTIGLQDSLNTKIETATILKQRSLDVIKNAPQARVANKKQLEDALKAEAQSVRERTVLVEKQKTMELQLKNIGKETQEHVEISKRHYEIQDQIKNKEEEIGKRKAKVNELASSGRSITAAIVRARANVAKADTDILDARTKSANILQRHLDLLQMVAQVQSGLSGALMGRMDAESRLIQMQGLTLDGRNRLLELERRTRIELDREVQAHQAVSTEATKALKDVEEYLRLRTQSVNKTKEEQESEKKMRAYFTKSFKMRGMKGPALGKAVNDALKASEDVLKRIVMTKYETAEKNVAEAKLKHLDVQKKAIHMYDAELQLKEQAASIGEAEISIMDNYMMGVKASAALRIRLAAEYAKAEEVTTKQIHLTRERLAKATTEDARAGLQIELNELIKKRLGYIQKMASITKVLRDGWIGAINAMTVGSGRISKIVMTQTKNTGLMVRYLNVMRTGKSGAMRRTGEVGRVGLAEAARFGTSMNTFVNRRGRGIMDFGGEAYKLDRGLSNARQTYEQIMKRRAGGALGTGGISEQFSKDIRSRAAALGAGGKGETLGAAGQPGRMGAYMAGRVGRGGGLSQGLTPGNPLEVRDRHVEKMLGVGKPGAEEAAGLGEPTRTSNVRWWDKSAAAAKARAKAEAEAKAKASEDAEKKEKARKKMETSKKEGVEGYGMATPEIVNALTKFMNVTQQTGEHLNAVVSQLSDIATGEVKKTVDVGVNVNVQQVGERNFTISIGKSKKGKGFAQRGSKSKGTGANPVNHGE